MKDKIIIGEHWKTLDFSFEHSGKVVIEVSNLGRVRTTNRSHTQALLKTPLINGYPTIKIKLHKSRNPKVEKVLQNLMKQVPILTKNIKELSLQPRKNSKEIKEKTLLLTTLKSTISKKSKEDVQGRIINVAILVHRAVAMLFCRKYSENQTLVGHLDFNKTNNRSLNLKWMTPKENMAHQQKNPANIAYREHPIQEKGKLTVTRVMLLKKYINEGRPMHYLVKAFKVTETQIYRIKRGENWANIPAAN
jgi:hypothetical protein